MEVKPVNDKKNTWTYIYPEEDVKKGQETIEQFFNFKQKNETNNVESTSAQIFGFMLTYIYPVIPFYKISKHILGKFGLKGFVVSLITLLFVFMPILLWGALAIHSSIENGWRYRIHPVVGILILLISLLGSFNLNVTQSIIWTVLIAVYVLGYYQLLTKKNRT